jgi:RND superfamily putative drug exporter
VIRVLHLARLSILRPRLALALWVAVGVALSLVGLGVSDALSPSKVAVAGTESARAVHLADAEFGPSQLVPVLLEGPRKAVDRQGPVLVRRLAVRRDTRVMSAWDGGPVANDLHPRPGDAMLIAAVARSDRAMFDGVQQELQRTVDRTIKAPVKAYVTGTPALQQGLTDASIDTSRDALLWAIPILFVVLLLLLRAPAAAALITATGAVTALAGFGAVALLGQVLDISPLAVALGSMGGLALSVAYALLIYRRWMEARAGGATSAAAAEIAVSTSGRAVLIGGTALVVALIVAAIVGPTDVLGSEGSGVVLGAMLGIGSAVVVMPAALTVLGGRLQAFSFGAPAFATRAWDRLVGEERAVVRRAVPTGALATGLLLVLAVPVLSLQIGPPSPDHLPDGSPARIAYDKVGEVMGPGWVAPYNMVIVSKTRPLTEPALLRAIDRLQARIARDRAVDTVVGPGAFAATSKDLGVLPRKLRESTKLLKSGGRDLGRLEGGLGTAGAGTRKLRAGLEQAAAGADALHSGSGTAQSGSGQLRDGLAKARSGAAQISAGLNQALVGARKLQTGAGAALAGSQKIQGGLGQAVKPVKQGLPVVQAMAADVASGTDAVKGAAAGASDLAGRLDTAAGDLQALNDPRAQAALDAVREAQGSASSLTATLGAAQTKLDGASAVAGAFASQVAQLSSGLSQLYAGSTALTTGIGQLKSGNAQLATGLGRLAGGGGDLTAGLTTLRDGASRLESGLGQLTTGSGQLAGGISSGVAPVGALTGGLAKMEQGVATFRSKLPSTKDLERLQRESPGLFNSGYFVLAAIAGARPADRNQARFAVNLDRGGTAGQILIVPTAGSGSDVNVALGERLRHHADAFADATRTEVALGGQAAQFGDFDSAGTDKLWPVIGAVAAAVALLLMAFLRTVLLPLVSVACSLLACAVAFALLQVLYGGSDPLLGGPGSFSPVAIMGIFAAGFGITTMLQVVLLHRTREEYVATGDAHRALLVALRETAAAATGAAAVMIAAVVPFALSDFMTVAQFGIGLAAAILIDAVIVRPVVLPAAVEVLGRASWWPTRPNASAVDSPELEGRVDDALGDLDHGRAHA